MQAVLMTTAVKALAARPHSSAELARKLAALCRRRQRRWAEWAAIAGTVAGAPPDDCAACVAAVMSQLRDMKLLDDAEYTAWHVRNRATFRPRSRLQLRMELAAKGVDAATVTAGIAGTAAYDEGGAAERLARRLARAHGARKGAVMRDGAPLPPWPMALVADVQQRLWARGFPRHIVEAAVKRAQGSEQLR
jgi:SOS response regulatory protein OraA/RecX